MSLSNISWIFACGITHVNENDNKVDECAILEAMNTYLRPFEHITLQA